MSKIQHTPLKALPISISDVEAQAQRLCDFASDTGVPLVLLSSILDSDLLNSSVGGT